MQPIIVLTDFSGISRDAFNYATGMAATLNTSLLTVRSAKFPFTTGAIFPHPATNKTGPPKNVEALKNNGITADNNKTAGYSTPAGDPGEDELAKICAHKDPLAVVMAVHDGNDRELFNGGTTVYLSENVRCPVVAVPRGICFTPVNKIVLASDLENLREVPVDAIINITTAFSASLDIVHVYNDEDKFEVMSSRISELSWYLRMLHPQFHFIKSGNVHEAVSDFARQNDSNFILTFSKKHAFFSSSTSRQRMFHPPEMATGIN